MTYYHYYHISFPGQALGGTAVVKSCSEEEAIDEIAKLFPRVKREEIKVDSKVPCRRLRAEVIYHWDGDY